MTQWEDVHILLAFLLAASSLAATTPDRVAIVYNKRAPVSKKIAEYYQQKRKIPARQVIEIDIPAAETISRKDYEERIAKPILRALQQRKLDEQCHYLVTTLGVPLRIEGSADSPQAEAASVDSELALLYQRREGKQPATAGPIPNPFYGQLRKPFTHAEFPMYMVTRLAGYAFEDVRGLIDRALIARDAGEYVIDAHGASNDEGEKWLAQTARLLPPDRVYKDLGPAVVTERKGVIGYASWGANDPYRRKQHIRWLRFGWLPGAIMTEFVSTNGRTFAEPPQTWTIGQWDEPKHYYDGSPQTLAGDYIREGVTGISANVYEPYLQGNPRPQFLLPAYAAGRNLAESFYIAMPYLSWMGIVIGDPLCRLAPVSPGPGVLP